MKKAFSKLIVAILLCVSFFGPVTVPGDVVSFDKQIQISCDLGWVVRL